MSNKIHVGKWIGEEERVRGGKIGGGWGGRRLWVINWAIQHIEPEVNGWGRGG